MDEFETDAALARVCLECDSVGCQNGICEKYRAARRALGIVDNRGRNGKRHWFEGELRTVGEIAAMSGISESTLRRRMEQGLTIKRAVAQGPGHQVPVYTIDGEALPIAEWAGRCGVTYSTFQSYRRKYHLTVAEAVAYYQSRGEAKRA